MQMRRGHDFTLTITRHPYRKARDHRPVFSQPTIRISAHISLLKISITMGFALPPGVYIIHYAVGPNNYYVADPESDNDALTVTRTDQPPTTVNYMVYCILSAAVQFSSDEDHVIQWLISGDGVIRSLDHDRKFASARLAPKTSNIFRSSASMKWIINVFVFAVYS
jgi:hypothetical protein